MLVIQPHPTFSIPAQSTWMERHSLPHMRYHECRTLVLESLTWNVFPCSRPSLTHTTAHQILWCNTLMGPPQSRWGEPWGQQRSREEGKHGVPQCARQLNSSRSHSPAPGISGSPFSWACWGFGQQAAGVLGCSAEGLASYPCAQ